MGHIKGKRFAGILAVGLLATAGTGVAMAQGGISANLALSNTIFSQQVSGLDGEGAAIFVGTDKLRDSDVAVSKLKFKKAQVTDLCMAAPVKLPGLGDKKFQMKVPGQNFSADNLVIGAPGLNGGMTLVKPQIGVDASQLDSNAQPGQWGISASEIHAFDQKIKATSISADKLTAAGSQVSVVDASKADC
ncbi:DUF6230 family protein [Acidipropionibacterium jensenii]|uniref:DUF6230 family protein n=1 Tax=Acidipropionibacterium jensenii TaxID=1749 RepID=UPI0026470537|nr:DUF6230 family protein [Acidipropionibacterium jensenii]MDN6427963.1 DUF6230 family protein [Acidipropionibacterium jensenii]